MDPYTGQPLTDEDIAAMLSQQVAANAAAMDPFSASMAGGGEEIPPEENTQDQTTLDLGVS